MAKYAERFIADVQASGQHLRLICEAVDGGWKSMVYNVKEKKVVFQQLADNLDIGKEEAEGFTRTLIKGQLRITWQHITA